MKNKNADSLQSFLFEDTEVRGKIVRLNHSMQSIMHQHDYPPVICRFLSELLATSALLSSAFKYEGQLTLQFQGEGVLKMLVAKCNHQLEIRGVAQWDTEANTETLEQAFFSGQLIVTLENTRDKQRYQSIVQINQQSIAKAIETYFLQSEQIETKIFLSRNEEECAGLLLQKMPEEKQSSDFWQHIEILSETLNQEELLNWDNQRLLKNLFYEENIRLFEALPVVFRCTCSEGKAKNTLRLLGQKDALDYFLTNKTLSINCEYCNKKYDFNEAQVRQLFH